MLKVTNIDQVIFDITHLGSELKTFSEIIDRYENMDLTLFYHVISDPSCRYENIIGKHRIPPNIRAKSAENRFKCILRTKELLGHPKSYFVNKIVPTPIADIPSGIKSVSFTLSSFKELPLHFNARKSEYAICFFHDFLMDSGIRKVQYIEEHNVDFLQQLVFNSPYLLEICNKKYDMRWENEWRVGNCLKFNPEDVAFLIVPDSEYERLVNEFLDDPDFWEYSIIPSSTFTSPIDLLFMFQHFQDELSNSGQQLNLFRDSDGNGLIMDYDDFPPLTINEREEFNKQSGSILKAIAKSTIQNYYERSYVARFISFIEKVESEHWQMEFIPDVVAMKKNIREPWHSHVDLVTACYENIFDMKKKYFSELLCL